MRPLMEILEDERSLMLKIDTIRQNMIRYPGLEAASVLETRKRIVESQLNEVRAEIQEYIANLFKDGEL